MKEKKKEKKISVVKNNLYFLGLLWKISPMGVVLCFLEIFIQYAFWVFYSVIFYAVPVRQRRGAQKLSRNRNIYCSVAVD
ncbi:MAG: hypothetical protein U0L66_08145 [Acutalibacteraceae bacterium]|nr:hypothetical protein [Acutalibacteraceae bacterium]